MKAGEIVAHAIHGNEFIEARAEEADKDTDDTIKRVAAKHPGLDPSKFIRGGEEMHAAAKKKYEELKMKGEAKTEATAPEAKSPETVAPVIKLPTTKASPWVKMAKDIGSSMKSDDDE